MFGELKAKLAAIEAKLVLVLTSITTQVTLLEKDITGIDTDVLTVFDRADAAIKKAQTGGAKVLTDMKARVTRLSPPN
jgi:hypothetical protein